MSLNGGFGSIIFHMVIDLAVLSKDYLSVPVDEISTIHAMLTLVGGRAVYAEGVFAGLQEAR